MAPKKEGGRTRRETSAGQGERRKAGRAVEEDAGQGRRAAAVVDFDLWGAFFGELWGQGTGGGSGSADERPGGGRKAGKGARATATKSGR